jgi:hypothetical protein
MVSFQTFFLEYFIDNAKAYYMTSDGVIHDVHTDHLSQVIEDFDLEDDITSFWNAQFGEDPDWDKDWEWISDWMIDYKVENNLLFIVFDITNKIVYVRGSKNDPNPIQREKLIEFCISKNSELIYDPRAIA